MQPDSMLSKLEKIFREVFKDPGLHITPSTSVDDIEGWDSLTHMTLINQVEEFFSVHFGLEEVMGIENVQNILDILKSKSVL